MEKFRAFDKRVLVGKASEKLKNRIEAGAGTLVVMPYRNRIVREHIPLEGNERRLFGARNQGLRVENGKYYAWVSDQDDRDAVDDADAATRHDREMDEVEIPEWLAKSIDFGYRLRISEYVRYDLEADRRKFHNENPAAEKSAIERAYMQRLFKNLLVRLLDKANCHKTMLKVIGLPLSFLRTRGSGEELVRMVFAEDAEKVAATNIDVLQEKLNATADESFPLVINRFIVGKSKPSTFLRRVYVERVEAIHSFVVLGRNKRGKYICFHKFGDAASNRIGLDFLSEAVDMNDHTDGYSMHSLEDADALLEEKLSVTTRR